jgi:hypothetical protein
MSSCPKSCSAILSAVLFFATPNAHAANPRSAGVTVPVMTPLTVKLGEAINSRTVANGSGFTATIKDPVQVAGVIAIPANSSAGGLVIKGVAGEELVLNSIFVNGKMYRVTTSPVSFNQRVNLRAGSSFTFHLVLSLNLAR